MDKSRIIQRWTPIFVNVGLSDTKFRELLCLFAEDYSIRGSRGDVDQTKLPMILRELIESASKSCRVEVKRTFYNSITGKFEYELENGLIVDENNKFKSELTTSELISLFGTDFVREIDKQGFREERINELLNG